MSDAAYPTKLSFNRDQVAESIAQEVLAEEANVIIVIDEIKRVASEKPPKNAESGPGQDLILKYVYGVLDPRDPESGQRLKRFKIYGQNWLPVPNPEFPDHLVPDWAHGLWAQTCQAFLPDEHPRSPYRRS